MNKISPEELKELYDDALNRCGIFLLAESDEVIGYQIYEQFDVSVHSYLHISALNTLVEYGLISKVKYDLSNKLWEKYAAFMGTEEWQFKNFRTSKKWLEIMQDSDEIKKIK